MTSTTAKELSMRWRCRFDLNTLTAIAGDLVEVISPFEKEQVRDLVDNEFTQL